MGYFSLDENDTYCNLVLGVAPLVRTDIDKLREEITAWLKDGLSRQEVCERLNCRPDTLRRRLDAWGVTFKQSSYFPKGNPAHNRRPIQDYLVSHGPLIHSHILKQKLWKEGLKPRRCELCDWAEISQDGTLPLELHHRNSDRFDNQLKNLWVLCPNCHSLQSGHGSRKHKGH